MSPLHGASQRGETERVKQLLDEGALLDEKDEDGDTALMLASLEGHTKVVQLLLDKGALLDAVDAREDTALLRLTGVDEDHLGRMAAAQEAPSPSQPPTAPKATRALRQNTPNRSPGRPPPNKRYSSQSTSHRAPCTALICANRSSSRCPTPRPRGISRRATRPGGALTATSLVTTFAGYNA